MTLSSAPNSEQIWNAASEQAVCCGSEACQANSAFAAALPTINVLRPVQLPNPQQLPDALADESWLLTAEKDFRLDVQLTAP
jgi:hypothetical protein